MVETIPGEYGETVLLSRHLEKFGSLSSPGFSANGRQDKEFHNAFTFCWANPNYTNRFHHAFLIFSDFCQGFFGFNPNFSLESSKHDEIWIFFL